MNKSVAVAVAVVVVVVVVVAIVNTNYTNASRAILCFRSTFAGVGGGWRGFCSPALTPPHARAPPG